MSKSLLRTDAYKLSMAAAGFPLRQETFYLSFRQGGWHYVPFDGAAEVRRLLPDPEDEAAIAFAATAGYPLSAAMRAALAGGVEVTAVPAGSWVAPREPVLTITGPSFLVSWLEPLVIRLHHRMQIATQLLRGTWTSNMGLVVGQEHEALVAEVAAAIGVRCPELTDESGAYAQAVAARGRALLEVVEDPARVFEVGMRSAYTEEQHAIALAALRDVGIVTTSNVALAQALGLKPVGTMGHEHVQRWGDDLQAFRAMRDMRSAPPSYLLDTFDTIRSGIPAALRVMQEHDHACSIRYDSGDKFAQYMYAHGEFSRHGLEPVHVLEDGLGLEDTRRFESLRSFTGLSPAKQVYGYGGYLVARPASNPLTRDRISAVYKLCESACEGRMKFGDERGLGKRSVPGRPVIWRRLWGDGPVSMIGQAGESVPEGYVLLSGNPEALERLALTEAESCGARNESDPDVLHLSPETQSLEASLAGDTNVEALCRS